MTIEVYQAEFRSLGEKYEIESAMTIHEFVVKQSPNYENTDEHRVNAYVNGELIDSAEWKSYRISPADSVEFVLEPKGGGAFLIGAVVAAVVATAAAILLRPSIPSIGGRNSQQGSSIYEVNAQGNRPKLGDVIPDQLGRHKVYPDVLTAPVRRWTEDNRSQELCLFMSLGNGYFEEEWDTLKIGSTPVNTLPGISYQAFEPGEYVGNNHATQNWYNAPEVGASTGSSGLRLRGNVGGTINYSGQAATDGAVLTLASNPPSGWDSAVRVRIQLFQSVTVGSNGTSIFGDFQHLSNGLPIRIQTQNLRGNYRVRSVSTAGLLLEHIDTGALIDNFSPGDYTIVIDRLDAVYRIVDQDNRRVRFQRMIDEANDDTTWSEFQQLAGYVSTGVYAAGFDPGLWTGAFLACPESETTSVIEWDVFCPNGLGYINDDGGIGWRERDIELQWRHKGNSGWNSIIRRIGGNSRDQLGWTFREIIPAGTTPEVRVRRTSIEDESTQSLDKIEWYGLRSWLPTNESYEGITTLAMIIRGSDLIASQTENQINLIQTRRLPTWDGSGWSGLNATRDISAGVRYIAHSVGYTDDDIDTDELIRLHYVWDGRGDKFDYVFDEPTTVKEAENTVLRAGMAELTTDGGRITPVRDAPRTTPEHMYSPQNYIEGGGLAVSVSTPRRDDPDGIDVEYFDENSWTTEIVKCRLPGDSGFRAEKVRIDGVTSRLQAYRIGMRERSRQKYARWQYRFATPTDALNSKYLSYCVVAGEVPGFAQSAIIEQVSQESDGVHIESSEPLDWNNGVENVVSWRRADGSYSGAWPAERGDDDYHVIAQIPAGDVPVIQRNMEPPHLLFGEGFHVLVRNIEPDGESVDVTAENYDERVYAYDNANYP